MTEFKPGPVDRCGNCGVVYRSHEPSDHPFVPSEWDLNRLGTERELLEGIRKGIPSQKEFTSHDLGHQFLAQFGLNPTPDAVSQLMDVFLPCLQIMIERGYEENGAGWKQQGWRGLVFKAQEKMERIMFHSWYHRDHDRDSALDGINFLGFYVRTENKGEPWGSKGEPL